MNYPLNLQMEKSSRRDLLIKDLYVENANLTKSLYESDKKEKELNSRASKLQDRCAVLQVIVHKVTQAALAWISSMVDVIIRFLLKHFYT